MLKTIFSKVMWVGSVTVFAIGLVVMLAVVLGVTTTALAAVPGDPFRLGQGNTIDRISQLVGSTSNTMLRIDNNGTGSALQLLVEPGRAPLTVNSTAGKATNFDADKLDGRDSAGFARAYKRTVVVSPVGAATQNGAALRNALSDITDASESNPYLLKIEPGIYDLGSSPLRTKPYVDIEGSGEGITTLTATSSANPDTGTVVGAVTSAPAPELRFLTVENDGGGQTYSTAIYNSPNSRLRLTHVSAGAFGSFDNNRGVVNGSGGELEMKQSTVNAGAGGILGVDNTGVLNDGSVTMTESAVNAGGSTTNGNNIGVRDRVATARIDRSLIVASTNTVLHEDEVSNFAYVGASQLQGGPTSAGRVLCAGVYDETYDFFPNTCP